MTEREKSAIRAAIEALNERGAEAASFLRTELTLDENSDAEAWIAGLWELQRETQH